MRVLCGLVGSLDQCARVVVLAGIAQTRNASPITLPRCAAAAQALRSQSSMRLLWLVAAAGGAGLAAGLAPPGALFLGIDLSTQSCTAVVVDARLDVVHRHSVNFDERSPCHIPESARRS